MEEIVNEVLVALDDANLAKDLFAGGAAGAISRTLTAPLDRIKLLMQEGRNVVRPPSMSIREFQRFYRTKHGMVSRSQAIFKEGGWRAFFRGNLANVFKVIPEQSIRFMVNDSIKRGVCEDGRHPTAAENALGGAGAGLLTQLLIYPAELVKSRVTVSRAGEYAGILDCIRQSYRRGGLAEFYRGLSPNLLGAVPYSAIEMGLFFTLRNRFMLANPDVESLPSSVACAFGAGASTVAQLFTYPFLLVRTRLQTQGVHGRPVRYRSVLDCFRKILAEEGAVGLYRGLAANYLKALPATCIVYVVYERVRGWLDVITDPGDDRAAARKTKR